MTYPFRKKEIATRTIDNQAVAISAKTKTLATLNEVGTMIWEMSDGKTSSNDIAKHIADEFDVDLETAKTDTDDFCERMSKLDLISILDNPLV